MPYVCICLCRAPNINVLWVYGFLRKSQGKRDGFSVDDSLLYPTGYRMTLPLLL